MPFMLNGTAMNKPMLNGSILNCLHGGRHVWLQNHWTGTPNASTSTLSKDGAVVATNLETSPVIRNGIGWIAANSDLSNSDAGVKVTNSSTDADSFLYTSSDRPVPASTPITIRADIVASDDPGNPGVNGSLFVMELNSTGVIAGYQAVNNLLSIGEHSISFTTHPTTVSISVRRYTSRTQGKSVTWKNYVGIYTQSDWQAMQALGITRFDGYTYTRQRKG